MKRFIIRAHGQNKFDYPEPFILVERLSFRDGITVPQAKDNTAAKSMIDIDFYNTKLLDLRP